MCDVEDGQMVIDAVDYGILNRIDTCGPLWKTAVHNELEAHVHELPFMNEVSLQTVGRRIDALHEQQLIESCILSPDSVKRDLIIGYKLTGAGEELLAEKRGEFLRAIIKDAAITLLTTETEEHLDIQRDALLQLMCDQFNIDKATRKDLLEPSETQELIGILAIHFFREHADSTIHPDSVDRLAQLIDETPALQESFTTETVVERIREKLAARGKRIQGQVWKLVQSVEA